MLNFFEGKEGLAVILAAISANFLTQCLKMIFNVFTAKNFEFRLLTKTGGMPSSHSAMVTCTSTYIGLLGGWNSVTFALSVIVALIIMHDAASVRRSVGQQARILNQLAGELFTLNNEAKIEKIKELLGHTPIEVFVGALIGCLHALVFHWAFTS